ncbi:hypothetical protein WJR50_28220 [Catalinimonas sp. 4WD22]|uniref:hypothetical protein n=1 Tax=Catalinimonas locisalis TaxID=3133978 RepID=UPI0031012180
MKKSLLGLLGLSIFGLGILTSCEDEFTEEDALQRQEELLNKQQENAVALENLTHEQLMAYTRLQDSLERIGGVIVYSVRVMDAANANTTNARKAMVEGATVTVIQNGVAISETADENGIVVFDDMRIGQVNVTAKIENYTSAFFTADITPSYADNKTVHNASTTVPLFPITVEAGAGRITGKVYAETNLLNDDPEMAVGAKVTASIDLSDNNFKNNFLLNDGAGVITSITYENATVSTTVGEDGTYELIVPAGIGNGNEGLPIALKFANYSAEQILVHNNSVDTVSTMFIPGGGSSVIPNDPGVLVSLPDFTAAGTGAELTVSRVETRLDLGDNFDVEVINGGAGYVGVGGEVRFTIEGAENTLAVFEVNADGKITNFDGFTDYTGVDITLSDADDTFTSEPVLGVLYDFDGGTTDDTDGSGAKFKVKFMSDYELELANGGAGYTFLPSVKVKYTYYNDMTMSSGSGNASDFSLETAYKVMSLNDINGMELIDGTMFLVNNAQLPNASSALLANQEIVSFEIVEVMPMERVAAEILPTINSEGELTSITVIDGGQGYTPGQRIDLEITSPTGAGSGAIAYITESDIDQDGEIQSITVVAKGSGYKTTSNGATQASAGSMPSQSVAAGESAVVNYNYGTGIRE